MSKILLRNLGAALNVESPSDYIMAIKPCILDASGFAVIDLKQDVRDGATVYYTLLSSSNVFGGASTTSEGLTVTKGSIIVGLTASTEDDPATEAITEVPAASTPTIALVFYPASDNARHGASFI